MTTPDGGGFDPAWQQTPAEGGYAPGPDQSYPPLPGNGYPQNPAYGAPQYGAPQYGGPQPYGQAPGAMPPPGYAMPPVAQYGGYPAPPVGTSGLAIGSLIASCFGFLYGIPAIVGIILGIVALSQIKQTRQQGRGLAIAGIAVGGVFVALFVIVVIAVAVAAANSSY